MRTSLVAAMVVGAVLASVPAGARRILTDEELAEVRGSAAGVWTCKSVPCDPGTCGWDRELEKCKQTDNDGHPHAYCTDEGIQPTCCTDTVNDCYRQKTLTPVEPGNCEWACDHKADEKWSAWTGFTGEREIHCRYENCE